MLTNSILSATPIPTMKLKICNCPEWVKKKKKLENGKTISGCWVHPSTCAKHWSWYNLPLNSINDLSLALLATSPVSRRPEQSHLPGHSTNTSEENGSQLELDVGKNHECITIILLFIAWLGLVCGVSQQNCQITRDWISFIVEIFQKVPQQPNSSLSTYKYIQTITKRLFLNPELERSICFPKCFSL
ncbi:hypothetical protein VP01_723g4 [Puccinia sorghi]|uniref:Uncharacterized protein n=1 Tax=Puccinia sorghi TaxID=27349 RepID=A0A0L6UFB9_9BASI|nr:hypothetical protein VP01_723g4 [Puccinia sorghi]